MSIEVVVLSAARSAIGSYGGGLSSFEPQELGATVLAEAIRRSGVGASKLESLTCGNCIPTNSRFAYVSRCIAVIAGMPMESIALTVNRLCSSGLQGVVNTAQQILLGDIQYGAGGGVEVMSKGGYMSPNLRFGQRMGDAQMIDLMVATLTDPFGAGHMGITAENLAEKWNLTREAQDAFAVESHRRAAEAIDAGRFEEQIVPIIKASRKGDITIDTDENVRPGTTIADLTKMRPAFKKDGTVTAGNASGINDGAAFLILANRAQAEKDGHQPMARLVSYALAGVPNHIMGEGPIPASQRALANAGLNIEDMDVIESNEAFAAQALAVAKGLNLDMDKTNPNGGAIALGHPVGCSGAFIAIKALYELQRINGRFALVTMCIGGGQGIACVFENL
jgi:acetyl-CoA C-acetyltransferase